MPSTKKYKKNQKYKKRTSNRPRTIKVQNGGIIIAPDKTPKEAFDFFIQNSKVEIFTPYGANGIIVKAILDEDIQSPYTHSNAANYGEPVKELLIKLCYVLDDDEYEYRSQHQKNLPVLLSWIETADAYIKKQKEEEQKNKTLKLRDITFDGTDVNEYNEHNLNKKIDEYISLLLEFETFKVIKDKQIKLIKNIQEKSYFIEEVNIQTEIFSKSLAFLEPLCPAPIYSDIKLNESANAFLETLISKKDPEEDDSTDFLSNMKGRFSSDDNLQLGVLGMEIATGFSTLQHIRHDYREQPHNIYMMNNRCRMQLIKLALDTGYHHGDFHSGNVLIDRSDPTRIPLIIDFGYSLHIPPLKMRQLRKLDQERKYVDILKELYKIPRNDGTELNEYPYLYEWITKEPEVLERQMKTDLNVLNQQLEERKLERVIQSKDGEKKYPELPLSKADIAKFSLFERGFRKRGKLRGQLPQIVEASIFDGM